MATFQFKLPDIGEGIAEAEVVAWHVAIGDPIEEDAPLVDLMTDKATVEISSPVSGRVLKLAADVGESVAIGITLAELETDEKHDAETIAIESQSDAAEETLVLAKLQTPESEMSGERLTDDARDPPGPVAADPHRFRASPAVRQRAKDLGVDLTQLHPSDGERVRHSDLDAFLRYDRSYNVAGHKRQDEQIKVTGLRRRIADNLSASKRHIPHFSYVDEVDVTKLEALRHDLNEARCDRRKLSVLPLLIIAVCKAVEDYPMINARYDDESGVITRSGAVHLGIATQSDAGLMVPVIRNANEQNVWQLASAIKSLADAVRAGRATSAQMSGSTLTITSLGTLGGLATTPVINRPEVAIIGPNRIVERPIARDGAVVIAKMMNISMSCDHRVLDGFDAASFVQRLKHLLETPALLFVE